MGVAVNGHGAGHGVGVGSPVRSPYQHQSNGGSGSGGESSPRSRWGFGSAYARKMGASRAPRVVNAAEAWEDWVSEQERVQEKRRAAARANGMMGARGARAGRHVGFSDAFNTKHLTLTAPPTIVPTEVATTPTAQPSPAGALEEQEGPKEVACQTPTSLRGRIESMLGVSKPVPVAVGSRVELKLRPSRGGREAALVKGVVR